MRNSCFHAEQGQRIVVNYGNMVMDAIKYTSKALLAADVSIHRIIYIKFYPCRWDLFSKGKLHKLESFPFLCSKERASKGISTGKSSDIALPTLSRPFDVGPWRFQNLHVGLCSFAVRLSIQKAIDAIPGLLAIGLLAISLNFATRVPWHGSLDQTVHSTVCL